MGHFFPHFINRLLLRLYFGVNVSVFSFELIQLPQCFLEALPDSVEPSVDLCHPVGRPWSSRQTEKLIFNFLDVALNVLDFSF